MVRLGDHKTSLHEPISEHVATVTPDELCDALSSEVLRLQSVYEREITTSTNKSKLIAPRWPQIARPDVRDVEAGQTTDGDSIVLRFARWVADAADCWDQIEEIRLARTYMRNESGEDLRPIPWLANAI